MHAGRKCRQMLIRHELQGGRQQIQTTPARAQRRHDRIEGLEHIDKIHRHRPVAIGPHPAVRIPPTIRRVHRPIREWLAGLPRPRRAATSPAGRHSVTASKSRAERCERLQGDGRHQEERHVLPDVYAQATSAKGKRYKRETLEVL